MIWFGLIFGGILAVFMFYHKRKMEDARLKSIIQDSTKNNGQDSNLS